VILLADNPGDFCVELPFGLGEVCTSDVLDWVFNGGDGNGDKPKIPNGNGVVKPPKPIQPGNGQVHGCPQTVALQMEQRAKCPPGYVAVDSNGDGVNDVCMQKASARACGLWKPARKPPISASQYRTLKTANSVAKKVKRIAIETEKTCRGSIMPRRSR
jgi:hypothetical protein